MGGGGGGGRGVLAVKLVQKALITRSSIRTKPAAIKYTNEDKIKDDETAGHPTKPGSINQPNRTVLRYPCCDRA